MIENNEKAMNLEKDFDYYLLKEFFCKSNENLK
jgi:hypothetical protein